MMHISAVVQLLIILVIVAFRDAATETNCVKNTNACIRSTECCTGCCRDGKCVNFSESCLSDFAALGVGKGGLCALIDPPCPSGQICELQQVQCVQSPCPPIPSCVPSDYYDYD